MSLFTDSHDLMTREERMARRAAEPECLRHPDVLRCSLVQAFLEEYRHGHGSLVEVLARAVVVLTAARNAALDQELHLLERMPPGPFVFPVTPQSDWAKDPAPDAIVEPR